MAKIFWISSREERACEGLFMAFQYPVEIPGAEQHLLSESGAQCLQRKHHGQEEMSAVEFISLVKEKLKILHIESEPAQSLP